MARLLKITLVLLCLALVALLMLLLSLVYFSWRIAPKVEMTLRATHAAADEAALTAKNLRQASETWKKASADQSSAITSAARGVTAAARQLSASASGVERSSTALLNELTQDAREQNTALLLNQQEFQKNLVALQEATGAAQQALRDADARVNDPNLQESLDRLAAASANAAEASQHLSAIAADGQQVADKFRQDYLKPQKFAWELLKELIGLGGSMAQMVK